MNPVAWLASGLGHHRKGRHIVAARDPDAPDRSDLPGFYAVRVPAHLRFLSLVRVAVGVLTDSVDCDEACDGDLRLAADELASVLIADARPWSELELVVGHDEEDIYVRMSAYRDDVNASLVIEDLTRTLLTAAVESYDVRAEAMRSYGILQRPLVKPG